MKNYLLSFDDVDLGIREFFDEIPPIGEDDHEYRAYVHTLFIDLFPDANFYTELKAYNKAGS